MSKMTRLQTNVHENTFIYNWTKCCLLWAELYVTWKKEWECVIFSDKKKFNLDGPDIWNGYWHDLREERRWLKKQSNNRRSVTVLVAIQSQRCTYLVFLSCEQNVHSYTTWKPSTNLMLGISLIYGPGWHNIFRK